MKPAGTEVRMDGYLYIVAADGEVYVLISGHEWRRLPPRGSRAAAVRHQLREGHTS
jgi:hypothetical protein